MLQSNFVIKYKVRLSFHLRYYETPNETDVDRNSRRLFLPHKRNYVQTNDSFPQTYDMFVLKASGSDCHLI